MKKLINISFLLLLCALILACSSNNQQTVDLPLLNLELLANSQYLHKIDKRGESGLINERGEWVLPLKLQTIIPRGSNCFIVNEHVLLKKQNWEILPIGEIKGRIEESFEWNGQYYFITTHENEASFLLDETLTPLKMIPATIYKVRPLEEYCILHSLSDHSYYLDQKLQLSKIDSAGNLLEAHPKYDHVLLYHLFRNDRYLDVVHNLENGRNNLAYLDQYHPDLFDFYALIEEYFKNGVDSFPMIINPKAQLQSWQKQADTLKYSHRFWPTIKADSIQLQFFNWDLEPVSKQVYPGRIFNRQATAYAQIGKIPRRDKYSLLIFEKQQLIEDLPLIYTRNSSYNRQHNWIFTKTLDGRHQAIFQNKFLPPIAAERLEPLNAQYFWAKLAGQQKSLYDSTGQEVLSAKVQQFWSVLTASNKVDPNCVVVQDPDSLHFINFKTAETWSIPFEVQQNNNSLRLRYYGQGLWSVDGLGLIKEDSFYYKTPYSYHNGQNPDVKPNEQGLIYVQHQALGFNQQQQLQNMELLEIYNQQGQKVLHYNLEAEYCDIRQKGESDLLEVRFKFGNSFHIDAGSSYYFDLQGRQLWPEEKLPYHHLPSIQTANQLEEKLNELKISVTNYKKGNDFDIMLQSLVPQHLKKYNYFLYHVNQQGYRKQFVLVNWDKKQPSSLRWDKFAELAPGDFLILSSLNGGKYQMEPLKVWKVE